MTQLPARIDNEPDQIATRDTGTGLTLPRLIADAGPDAEIRFLEFFAATIRNPHTRRAYARTIAAFLDWCAERGVAKIADVKPLHVSAWIEARTQTHSAPTVKQGLAAIRHLFDWLVVGQIVSHNPAAAVRGPKHVVKKGKTPVLDASEARILIDSIDVATNVGLRNRALIGLMVYSFARIGAGLAMKVEDVYTQNRRLWVRLREKGGKRHEMPCHHNLELYLTEYLERTGLGRAHRHPPAPSQCLCNDPTPRKARRPQNQNRQSFVPRDRDHDLSQKQRHARESRRHGEPCLHPDYAAL
jgi:site-specific recombinase XerD